MRKIRELLSVSQTSGDVGIEIEVEAQRRLPSNDLPTPWRAEADGSLRGYAMEYITNGPISITHVDTAVNSLAAIVEPSGPQQSFRAGVHIHLNAQELTLPQVGNVVAAYYCLETALMKFCGESREGNHFCLRLKDAKYPLRPLLDALNSGELYPLDTDQLRYSALNLRALTRYGSLEFRGMETTPNFSKINEWSQILCKLRTYGEGLQDRTDIAFDMSADGPENWARMVLGDELFRLIDYQNFQTDVMSCLRDIQTLIYQKATP